MAEDTQKVETGTEAATAAETAQETAASGKEIKDLDTIRPGAVVRVHQKIKEMTPKGEERERIQVFEGTVIAKKGKDAASRTITVRKISSGVGVERIFPLRLPTIAKIEEIKKMKTRRAKLYFIRTSKKHLKEEKRK